MGWRGKNSSHVVTGRQDSKNALTNPCCSLPIFPAHGHLFKHYLRTSLKGFCRYDWSPNPVDLKVERLSRWTWSYEVNLLRQRVFWRWKSRRQRFKVRGGDLTHCFWVEDGGGSVWRNAGGHKELKSGPCWQLAKKLRLASIFDQWPEWVWRQVISWGLRIKVHPKIHLVFYLWDPKQRTQLSHARLGAYRYLRETICIVLCHCIYGNLLCINRKRMQ